MVKRALRSGCTVPTIRYYEEIGLLVGVVRGRNGRRVYFKAGVARLALIRRRRDFGLSIIQVRELTAAMDQSAPDCGSVRDLALAHGAALRAKRMEIRALETTLLGFVASCKTSSGGPGTDGCRIVDDFNGLTPA